MPERVLLVEDIWDGIAEVPEELPLTADQKSALAWRLEAYHQNSNAGSQWLDVKNQILK